MLRSPEVPAGLLFDDPTLRHLAPRLQTRPSGQQCRGSFRFGKRFRRSGGGRWGRFGRRGRTRVSGTPRAMSRGRLGRGWRGRQGSWRRGEDARTRTEGRRRKAHCARTRTAGGGAREGPRGRQGRRGSGREGVSDETLRGRGRGRGESEGLREQARTRTTRALEGRQGRGRGRRKDKTMTRTRGRGRRGRRGSRVGVAGGSDGGVSHGGGGSAEADQGVEDAD